ncbi:sigma-70 family RNA polymerase sigma factor [Actinoplanes subtropicus]|uniref:sigma-70 family RNA polymerase sigma factor n=1 Tax=Actinoplanes subtropicus TaxID=543632 RepID=UPI00068AF0F7|nr:sigma-70 family RNA polymerase sigma factor [Actinoplanes subtropicus]
MEATERDEAVHGGVALVVAAQGGDREALDELVAAHLPLVYTIVGRALGRHADVDDVVQETMLRAVRDLPALRAPASFRAWLTSIAVRRVVEYRQRRRIRSERTVVLDEELEVPDAVPAVEDMSLLRLDVSEQRREVAEATEWLDPGDRLVLSLWWQETAGRMRRAEVATALGLSVAHTAVRIQRMREQLELARAVVAALADRSRCAGLAEAARKWDGKPGSVWRKRFIRHTRACPVCGRTAPARIPADRLLAGSALLVVPPGLAKTVAAGTATSAGAPAASWGGKLILAKLLGGHPVAAVVAVTAVAAVAVPAVLYQHNDPAPIAAPAPPAATRAPAGTGSPSRAANPAPSRTAPPAAVLAPDRRLSLESVLGGYLTAAAGAGRGAGDEARLTDVGAAGDAGTRRRATFVAVAGLADARCYSFRTLDGRYLRHWELHTYTHRLEDTELFRQDATFCPQPGAAAGAVMLESHNYANQFLTWTGGHLLLRYNVGTASFRADSSFRIRGPWAD